MSELQIRAPQHRPRGLIAEALKDHWSSGADPKVFLAVLANAQRSWAAGLCGALASSGWFVALALAPAASVRAVGVVEAPMAAFTAHRLLSETLRPLQLIAGAAVAAGVILTALG